eukprot:CAMPEP_0172439732 /NCGR_PEP_ID=MMETSP1065-20121228/618_1 /TAXON_ID=265537 /ORGANISM="Amphiprora paludosa, Strain CCMP125" /LENGTH=147 /DNA_ID=CAMNT_0013188453 /DNA_START=49 /DNA_END=492 /DNA_ORIENTATION=-
MTFRLAVFSILVSLAVAFAPVVPHVRNARSSALNMVAEEGRGAFLRRFSLICGGIAASTMTTRANAAIPDASSSMLVADTVKVLDMGLPSYGDISSAKSSVENTKSLSVDPAALKGLGVPTRKKSAPKEAAPEKKKKKKSSMPSYIY